MELFKASAQWANRPADERFEDLQSLYNATKAYADVAKEKDVPFSTIRTEAVDGDVQLVGKANVPAKLTHWAFGQLSRFVGAPADYLRTLPATLATQNLNHGLAQRAKDQAGSAIASLLFHVNGGLLLRAITSDKYARIWNYEVAERLLDLQAKGWTPAVPDLRFDGGDPGQCQVCNGTGGDISQENHGLPIVNGCVQCKGTGRALPSLYASDHDMFAFVRNSQRVVKESGNDAGLQRGVIVENSEVGASSLKLTRFLYREMCGNHIIWGAENVLEIAVRHVGDARQRWGLYAAKIREYADASASEDEARITRAKSMRIGATKDEVLDALFGKRGLGISRKNLDASYDAVVPDQDGDPNTVWGFVQGVTRHSQTLGYADQRTMLDKAAGRILDAF
jgi:hypothetical protein